MALQLTETQAADLARVELELEEAFTSGAEYPPATNQVLPLKNYNQPMIVGGKDLTVETKPLVKSPFKLLLAAIMKAVQPWQAVVFQNSWANYGSGFHEAGYYKDFFGRVHLRGLVASGVSSVIFTLPPGYRPAFSYIFTAPSAGAYGEVRINSAGEVSMAFGDPSWISLSGISFKE